MRLRLRDIRMSRFPQILGLCPGDVGVVAEAANAVQERLVYAREAGEEGWYGTWAEMVFNIDPASPYLTTPREVARIEHAAICDAAIAPENQFFEYLLFGNGTLANACNPNADCSRGMYSRNNVVTFTDLANPPKLLRAYYNDTADVGKNVLFQGTDNNDKTIYSLSNAGNTRGVFVNLTSPFVTSPMPFNSISGIQKDITVGAVDIYQVDQDTGDEVLLLTMQPGEQVASYRRYYLDGLPANCCNSTSGTVQVKAIVKLELIPVTVDTDYLLIQSKEAMIAEAQSMRLSGVDSSDAKLQAQEQHVQAIRYLNGQLQHYIGTQSPALNFKPFGSADLSRVHISMM